MRFAILAGFVGLATLVAPTAGADILDIAIQVIKPELKPAKPVLLCALKGNQSVLQCAVAGASSCIPASGRRRSTDSTLCIAAAMSCAAIW